MIPTRGGVWEGCVCAGKHEFIRVFSAGASDLTDTYDRLTKSLIIMIHPLISSKKANADPHIYIHLLLIWSPTHMLMIINEARL